MRSRLAAPHLWLALAAVVCVGCEDAATRSAQHVAKGEAFLASDDYARARIELKNALRLMPHSPEAHHAAGLLAEREERWTEAIGHYAAAVEADPANRDSQVRLARLSLWTRTPDKALELAEQALQYAPGDPEALAARGAAWVQLGDEDAAMRDAQAAIAADAGNEYALSLMASLHARRGDLDAAIALLEEGARRNAGSASVRTMLAQLLVQTGELTRAAQALEEVIHLEPGQSRHRARLAALYVQAGDVDAAERVLRTAVADLPDDADVRLMFVRLLANERDPALAERELLGFVSEDPQAYAMRFALAGLYEAQGRVDEARSIYEQIDAVSGHAQQRLNAQVALARLDMLAGRNDEARARLAEILGTNPQDRKALVLRATLALSGGDGDAAIADLRAALRSAPDSVDVLRLLGRAYAQRNAPELGIEALQRAVELAPRDQALRLELATLAVQAGRDAAAGPHLESYLAQQPDDPAALELKFRLLANEKSWQAAEDVAARVRQLQPDQPLGYYLAGVAARAQGDESAAQDLFAQALARAPTAIEPLSALVRGYLAAGEPQLAIERLESVVELDPQHAVASNLLGEVLLAQGEPARARTYFERASGLQPAWWMPWRGMAAADLAMRDESRAVQTYRAGIEASGSAALVTDLALLYERRGEHTAAIAAYEELLRREPDEERAANNLAMLLVTHRADRASVERAWQIAARFLTSTNPAYLDTAGWVLVKRGEVGPAVRVLETAVQAAPEAPTLRYHLAMAYQASDEPRRALAQLDHALALDADFPARAAAQSARDALVAAIASAGRG